ncbi:hypothetical protein BDR03DRAFT_1007711 [Suillus americanus]|nr:hypothetical protein BDR03DRAFT_1007711 [Suillus americanus]
MEFAPSSPANSPPRTCSPAPTNLSSATRVEPGSLDFNKKTNHLNSPHLMTSEIGSASDVGSPRVPLSPVDEVPKPPEARQSVLYTVPKSPNAKRNTIYRCLKSPPNPRNKSPPGYGKSLAKLSISPSRRGRHTLERMSKNHIPCSSRPAPLELRFAARVSGRGSRPEFTAEEIREIYLQAKSKRK